MPYMPVVRPERPWADDHPVQKRQDWGDAMMGILSGHKGRERAITSRELAKLMRLSTREVRQVIADLVERGQLIGASVGGVDGGYYLIETDEELEETRAILRARATAIFQRDRALCRAWERSHGRPLQPLLPTMQGTGNV